MISSTLADAYSGSGDVQSALSCAVNALKSSEDLDRSMAPGISYRTPSDTWPELGDAAQAKSCYKQSFPILEEFKEEQDLVTARQGPETATRRLAMNARAE